MNKKILSKILAIVLILGIMVSCSTVLAFSEDGMSIDIPSSYSEMGDKAWRKGYTLTFNIQIDNNKREIAATKSALEDNVKELEKQFSGLKVSKSEVTKLNGYKSLYIESSYSGMTLVQYAIPTKDKVYVLTFVGTGDVAESEDVKSILDSFKIDNYKEPKSGSAVGIIVGIVVIAAIVGAVVYFVKKKKVQA